jgi:type IV pilus assembly protein PilX
MKNITHTHSSRPPMYQRGVVLFLALIALVAMSLAAVALIRSVDTGTIIAGNLAFKQSATTSGDSGPEGAIAWLLNTANANTSDPRVDPLHPFNNDAPGTGYFSSINLAAPLDLFATSTWAANSAPATGSLYDTQGTEYYDNAHTKPTGNTVRYIIQRMCRTPNQLLHENECLFGGVPGGGNAQGVGGGGGQYTNLGEAEVNQAGNPIYRITARVVGPKNTVSYIQAYAY